MLSARGWVLAVLSTLASLATFGMGVALAAPPEMPQVSVTSVTTTTVKLQGVLNPEGISPQEGTYEFVYAAAPSTCAQGAKGPQGMALGLAKEVVPEEVIGGLASGTSYSVCLLARNSAGEATLSWETGFTTSYQPEAPVTEPAEGVSAESAVLHGILNPNRANEGEPESYQFLYRASASECQGGESTGPIPLEEAPKVKQAVKARIENLLPNTQYTFCLRVTEWSGQSATGSPVAFTTAPSDVPSVVRVKTANLGVSSAAIEAEFYTGDRESTYTVQYGRTAAYGEQTSSAVLGPEDTLSTTELTGLEPNTEYHYSVTVTNKDGSSQSSDMTFTTYPSPVYLPDKRVYEMVTPSDNPYDADTYEVKAGLNYTDYPFQASTDGNSVVYVSFPTTGGTGSTGLDGGNQYLAVRDPGGGWSTTNIAPSGSVAFPAYEAFSTNLSTGYINMPADPPFVTISKFTRVYMGKHTGYSMLYATKFGENLYKPIFHIIPPNRGEKEFGARLVTGTHEGHGPAYVDSSVDNSHVLFQANDALLEEEPFQKELSEIVKTEIAEKASNGGHLYQSVNGRVELVSILPEGRIAPQADFGGQEYEYEGRFTADWDHVISSDGTRIFWSAVSKDPVTGERLETVYVRLDGTSTVQVSAGPAKYWTATADGRYAFYTEAGALWRFDVETKMREEITSANAGVQGVVGINQSGIDGSYVYFVAAEDLVGGEHNAEGQTPVAGGDNLYVAELGPQDPTQPSFRFIAPLSSQDSGDWAPSLDARTGEVAANGQAMVFASASNLTGQSYPGEGSEQVYTYEASSNRLFCSSCRPQGSGGRLGGDQSPVHMIRWISEDGDRVFFETSAPLVAQDLNGAEDVYEWEPSGSGECQEAGGCVYLLSSGLESAAYLVDTSASGSDVFMVTRQRLVPQDQNEFADLYDARVNGARPVSPPLCIGTGCQGVPESAPIFATPASVTFAGVGNFPPSRGAAPVVSSKRKPLTRAQKLQRALAKCRSKRSRSWRRRCESHAHRSYGIAHARTRNATGRVR